MSLGTVDITASANDALETGDIKVDPSDDASVNLGAKQLTLSNQISFEAGQLKAIGNLTLDGDFSVDGSTSLSVIGSLNISKSLTLNSQLTVTSSSKTSEVDLPAGIAGTSDLVVAAGAGTVDIGGELTNSGSTILSKTVADEVETGGQLQFFTYVSGDGGLQLDNGSRLTSEETDDYSGTIYLEGATLIADKINAFGSATIECDSAQSNGPASSTLQSEKGTDLDNDLTMAGGTLDVKENTTMTGSVSIEKASEIDPGTGVTLTLTGEISGGASDELTLGGTKATVVLAGQLSCPVKIYDSVDLATTFSGTGSLAVLNEVSDDVDFTGKLTSAGVGAFTGAITLSGGTLVINADNAFGEEGAGTITINDGSTITDSKSVKLSNSIILDGILTLKCTNNVSDLTIAGGVSVFTSGTIDSGPGASIALGSISGVGSLTLAGKGSVDLNGSLDTTDVIVEEEVLLDTNFRDGGTPGSFTVTQGGQLASNSTIQFTGSITLQSGKLLVGGTDPLGSGSLNVIPTGAVEILAETTKENEVVRLVNSLYLGGGTLKLRSGRDQIHHSAQSQTRLL